MNYRKIWITLKGEIPKDEFGRSYEIHHIDGNRKNNSIDNLMCVSIEEHYEIHNKQYLEKGNFKDLIAARHLAGKMNKKVEQISGYTISDETKDKISKKLTGVKHNPDRVNRMKEKLKGFKWTKDDIESRKMGIKKYYQEASEKELRKRWDKISEAKKGKKQKEETKEKLSKINSKLTDEEVLKIDEEIKNGTRYKVISEKFNISQAQITAIKQRKTYKWLWN
jgi:hypothetical protein